MTTSRTPYLDRCLSTGTCPARPVASADHARRTPALDRRLNLARREFDNPQYARAILRNMATLRPAELYDARALERLAAASAFGSQLDLTSMASLAACVLAEQDGVRAAIESRPGKNLSLYDVAAIDSLGELLDAFLAPFDDVAERINSTHIPSSKRPDVGGDGVPEAGGPEPRRAAASPSYDYRYLAWRLDMAPGATTYLLLRFCLMPAGIYRRAAGQLGARLPSPVGVNRSYSLLATFLDYRGRDRDQDLDLDLGFRMVRFGAEVLRPLAIVGGCVEPDVEPRGPDPRPERIAP